LNLSLAGKKEHFPFVIFHFPFGILSVAIGLLFALSARRANDKWKTMNGK